ncbi:hypothetical protein F5Y15DRAFT_86626 [Xylariaceae sp. FL0016]|nr:hypothetical protein F5Y15DRAFT_86626 [Xylariaceae sp. FL0016]
MSTFCPLCGVLIDMWQGNHDGAHPSSSLSWLQEVRAIRTLRYIHDPVITGVGWLNYHGEVIAPDHDSSHYQDYDPEQQELPAFFGTHQVGYATSEYWCFVVHDVCWELLREHVDPGHEIPADRMASHLFAVLYNTPMNGEILAPGHDYGGATKFQDSTVYAYYTRVNASRHSYITADVTEEFQFDDETLEDAPPLPHNGANLGGYSKTDAFCRLPNEILMLILALLASRDVCAARHASRYIADVASPGSLSQRFWKSRFNLEFEMGFAFAGPFCPPPQEPVDWRLLYLRSKVALNLELFPGFRNRHRVWHVLQNMTDALGIRISNEERISESAYANLTPDIPPGFNVNHTVYADASFDPGELPEQDIAAKSGLALSCRLFEVHSIMWPSGDDAKLLKMRVSYVTLNGEQYISGIRIHNPDDDCSSLGTSQNKCGFINHLNDHEVHMDLSDSLQSIDVVMAAAGVIGLCFHMEGPQGPYTCALGNTEVTRAGCGVGRLTPDDKTMQKGIVFGFDACKIISMALMEENTRDTNGRRPSLAQESDPEELWNPKFPNVRPTWHFEAASPTQHFNLCLNMDFGGPGGHLLPSLTRIGLFMGGYPAVFLGMSFAYRDGHETFFGRKEYRESVENMASLQAVKQSFTVDGPNGEIISKMTVSFSQDGDTIQSILIETNKGRSQLFRLYGTGSWGRVPEKVHVFEANAGQVLTSFYVKVKSPVGYFQDFSTRSENAKEGLWPAFLSQSRSISHHMTITCKALGPAGDILAYPRGFAFTAADLTGLKTIRVSVDKGGLPPLRGHLTGVWLEYDDSSVPIILGQWLEEFDSLTLAPGDRLVGVTTWHDFTNTYKRVKYGPIIKLSLVTANDITKEFLDPSLGGKVCLRYRENPYEKLDALVWGLNHQWDHVRVIASPRHGSKGNPLIIGPASHFDQPWMVREKVFMQEVLEDGRPNPVKKIEVSFKDLSGEPSGLTLTYENGDSKTVGTRGRAPRSFLVHKGEKLVRMEIGVSRGNRIEFINFLTNTQRELDFRERRDPNAIKHIHHRLVYILDPSFSPVPDGEKPGMRSIRDFPENAGSFVGFWAVPKRRDRALRFNMLGPVFDTAEVAEAVQPASQCLTAYAHEPRHEYGYGRGHGPGQDHGPQPPQYVSRYGHGHAVLSAFRGVSIGASMKSLS